VCSKSNIWGGFTCPIYPAERVKWDAIRPRPVHHCRPGRGVTRQGAEAEADPLREAGPGGERPWQIGRRKSAAVWYSAVTDPMSFLGRNHRPVSGK